MSGIIIENVRGLADSKWSGVKGAFAKIVGIDQHSKPGTITVHQKLTVETGTVPDELCKVKVKLSTGERYWFSSESGKIWEDSSGTWRLAHTTTPAAGAALCLGAFEYEAFLYWATQSRLHRIAISGISNWTANAVEDWATFDITNANYHPMLVQNQTLFGGDGEQVFSVDTSGTFSSSAMDLTKPLIIKTL